jgi:hypothetical protein
MVERAEASCALSASVLNMVVGPSNADHMEDAIWREFWCLQERGFGYRCIVAEVILYYFML